MDSRDNDDHNNNMDTTPVPAEIEMRDPDDLMEAAISTSLTIPDSSSSSERISLRRTRVDDDHDDERDRRHPSQRVGSPFQPSSSLSSFSVLPAPAAAAASTSTPSEAGRFPGLSNPTPSGPFRFFQHMPPLASPSTPSSPHVHLPPPQSNTTPSEPRANTSSSTDATAPSSNEPSSSGPNPDPAATRPQRPNIVHQYLGGFAISFDVNGARTTIPIPGTAPLAPRPNPDTNATPAEPHNNTDGPSTDNSAPEPSHPQPQPQPQQRRNDGGPPLPTNSSIADFLRHLSILTALSMGGAGLFDRDVEDPERAKKLVDGLEDVPVGLVKRLERVGQACGNGEDSTGADGTGLGDGGCAICWERLLTREREDEAQATEAEHTDTEPSSSVPPAAPSDSTPSDPTTDVDTDETATGEYKRIVSLPCAHVFHAKCLIPWFSKPKQTTCPICRFNIDPENLTYTSGAQRRAAARREREQERARARAEGRADNDNEERDDEVEDRNDGDGMGDFPLFGATPLVVPLGFGRRGGQQPADAAQNDAQDQPATDNAEADAPAEDEGAPHDGDQPHDHHLHDIVTIGVDMYIGRGPPPPFAMRGGANVFQFPFPTGGADGGPVNAGPAPPPANTNANTDDVDGAGASQPGEGNNAQANNNGRGEGRGAAFAIPLGHGFGRILGETFSRIFAGGHGPDNGGREQGLRTTGGGVANDGSGEGEQAQGPVMFGPERPPESASRGGGGGGSMPMPGGGGGGGRGPFTFSFPVGGGDAMQNGGQQGNGGGVPRMFETMIPLLDILFGPRTPGQGQGDEQEPVPQHQPSQQQQPAQPQPQHPQQANPPPPSGFGWTFISGPPGAPPTFMSGSPLARPASAPVPGHHRPRQEGGNNNNNNTRKVWVPPPAPGLSLRQRVEKKEQEAGLRCCDVSCGVGPSDEDPWVEVGLEGLRQLNIRKVEAGGVVRAVDSGVVVVDGVHSSHRCEDEDGGDGVVCDHTFHSSCLVSSERVALRGAEPAFWGEGVEVSCPVCRGVGRVGREDWERGVRALG